jgi:glycosyltransferase involved in cell wall biosynthesis
MKFSIGMATFDDFNGVYFTVMNLMMNHREWIHEIIIVDNNPTGPQSQRLKEFVANCNGALIRYVPLEHPQGTAPPRNRVFAEATSEYVVCLDSHVLPVAGFFDALAAFFEAHPDCTDLVQGPLLYDNLIGLSTHFADAWREGMWGTWDYDQRVETDPWFEIPAQGLGFFSCRKAAWLGFNPSFREFGGEEWYIHEKYRQAGNRTMCVSGCKWVHRFNVNPAYKHTRMQLIRNYIIGHRELNIPLDRCRQHFSRMITEDQWSDLIGKPCMGCTLRGAYDWARNTASDINEHVPVLALLAAGEVVYDCSIRHHASTIAFAHGKPSKLWIVNPTLPAVLTKITRHGVDAEWLTGDSLTAEVKPHDVLFIDTIHTGEHLRAELARLLPHTRKRLVVHDTVTYGDVGTDGKPGLLHTLKDCGWVVERHYDNNNGLTIMVPHAAS